MFGKRVRRSPTGTNSSHQQTGVTDVTPCRKAVRLQVPPDRIAPVRAAIVKEFQKRAALPGFRKGHAPLQLVEQQFAQPIQEETVHRATRDAFAEAVKTHAFKPVGPFAVSRADYQEGAGLTLEATVEVEPDFTLANYRGLRAARPSAAVTPAEMDAALEKLRASMAQRVPTGQGEAKTTAAPVLDDELAKDLGFETLVKLREHVEAKLREQKRLAQEEAVEAALSDELLRRHTFQLPDGLVQAQAERQMRDVKARLLLSGVPEASLEQEAAKLSDQLRTNAQRYVQLSFILDRIAEQEKVAVAERDLVDRLWQLARRWQKDPGEVRAWLDREELWPLVISTVRREKTVALIKRAAVIEDRAAPADAAGMRQPAAEGTA